MKLQGTIRACYLDLQNPAFDDNYKKPVSEDIEVLLQQKEGIRMKFVRNIRLHRPSEGRANTF